MSWITNLLDRLTLQQAKLLHWFLVDLSSTGYVESDGFRCEWVRGEADRRTHVKISHPRWEDDFVIQAKRLLALRSAVHQQIGYLAKQKTYE